MTRKRKNDSARLVAAIAPLAEEIVRLEKQAAALGLFTNDRELLECPQCGLLEDVTCEGFLITCKRHRCQAKDSGLRFKETAGEMFRCPSCKTLVKGVIL